MSPYQVVFGKSFLLPVKLEHKAYWSMRRINLDFEKARVERKSQLNELDEFRMETYESSSICKEKMKKYYDKLNESGSLLNVIELYSSMHDPSYFSESLSQGGQDCL
ncbi:Unknown protein [Striga hermonthica]|uniref:Uncharacterized protein n=1 Tax=Striga hermonthica TaxID=68872 RepID=A0A9N7R8I3_STRHE|nr:Unknown protein [Striga hermonthica]